MKCLRCDKEHSGDYGSGKYCSSKCAFTRDFDSIYRKKMSESTKKRWEYNRESFSFGESHSKAVGQSTKGKFNKDPSSLYDLSSRTISKILRRMELSCSNCGWDSDKCDLHHINGRNIEDPHNHENLCCLCPNCHRLVHSGKIDKEDLINLFNYIGDSWKYYYYG